MKKQLEILVDYVAHLAIGALMFVALLFFGGALNMLVKWAAPIIANAWFINVMTLVEEMMLFADIFFLAWWLVFSTVIALKHIKDTLKAH
jgi:hypothetical protein